MNCKSVQNGLLSSERPGRPSPDVAAHLDACAACREWQHQLVQCERMARRLPVPPSSAKAQVVRRILNVPAEKPAPDWAGERLRLAARRIKERGLKKLAASSGLAAGLAFFAVLWWAAAPVGPPKTAGVPAVKSVKLDPFLDRVIQQQVRLAGGGTPREKVESLASLADAVYGEARGVAGVAPADALDRLAKCYRKVVRDGLVAQARALPAEERAAVLRAVSGRLSEVSGDAERLARDLPAAEAAPLRDLAAEARDADLTLRALLEEKGS